MTILNRLLGAVKYIVKKADMVLLGLCLVCTAFGVVLIASATGYLGLAEQVKRVLIQSAGAVMGVAAYFIFSNVDMEHFAEKWWLFLIFDIGFIALLRTPLGREAYGNRSWIYVGLPMMIQPAEIVRLTFTVLLARQIAWFRDNRRMRGFGSLFWPAAHALFMFVWIFLLSRDAGSGMMYPIIYMGMALAAGLAWYWFALAIGSLGVGIGLLAVFEKLPKYWMDRFHVILDHSYSPGGVGYQQSRGLLALGSGGLFGQADGLHLLRVRRGAGHGGVHGGDCAGVSGGIPLLPDRPGGQELHGRAHLRGLRHHADLPDRGEHRHVPVCHAGHRPDPALFQLRRQFHPVPLRRHGHRLRRPEPDSAGLAADDVAGQRGYVGVYL